MAIQTTMDFYLLCRLRNFALSLYSCLYTSCLLLLLISTGNSAFIRHLWMELDSCFGFHWCRVGWNRFSTVGRRRVGRTISFLFPVRFPRVLYPFRVQRHLCGVKRNVLWLLASFDIDSLTSSLNRSHFHVRLYNSDLFNASKPTSNSVIVGCMAGFIYFLIIIQSCASGLDIFAYDRSLSLSSLPSSLDVVIAGLLTFYFLKKKDGNLWRSAWPN